MPQAAESRLARAFGQRGHGIDDAAAVAELMDTIWLAIDAALRGVFGPRGVAALYCRSLRLAVAHHAWMAVACAEPGPAIDVTRLKTEMALRSAGEALAAGATLLRIFDQLLASLIGPALTDRLLRPVWEESSGEPPTTESP